MTLPQELLKSMHGPKLKNNLTLADSDKHESVNQQQTPLKAWTLITEYQGTIQFKTKDDLYAPIKLVPAS